MHILIQVAEEVIDLALGFKLGITIALLEHTDKLATLSGDLLNLVIGEIAPLLADRAFQLHPLAFQNILVHLMSPFLMVGLIALFIRLSQRAFLCALLTNADASRGHKL